MSETAIPKTPARRPAASKATARGKVAAVARQTASPKAPTGGVTAEPSTARAQRRRVLIKDAVSAVLERVGYRAMKVADVAAEAGMATGLVYHYFPDLRTATCEVLADFIDELSRRVDALPKPADRFDAVYQPTLLWAQAYEQHPGLMRCLFQVADEVPEFAALWFRTNDQWTRRIARSIAREFPDAGMSEQMSLSIAYALGSMIDGLLNEIYVHGNPELRKLLKSPAHAAELLATIWFRALYLANPPGEAGGQRQVLQEAVLQHMADARAAGRARS